MNQLNEKMKALDIPQNIRRLPIDRRGFPVPWFVAWVKDGKPVSPGEAGGGEPDFRAVRPGGTIMAHNGRTCWLCGKKMLSFHKTFVVGPMCAVNRISSEPPSHLECAIFAARACPFLTQPKMRRNEKDLPDDTTTAGVPIQRNPGVCLVWTTRSYSVVPVDNGVLFSIGNPIETLWFCEGRWATHDEVMNSINTGLPTLIDMATKDGPAALIDLVERIRVALRLVPEEAVL